MRTDLARKLKMILPGITKEKQAIQSTGGSRHRPNRFEDGLNLHGLWILDGLPPAFAGQDLSGPGSRMFIARNHDGQAWIYTARGG